MRKIDIEKLLSDLKNGKDINMSKRNKAYLVIKNGIFYSLAHPEFYRGKITLLNDLIRKIERGDYDKAD